VTGKPAQFGRGVMQDVSDKLLGQFVDCLEQRLGEPSTDAAPPAAVVPDEPAVENTVSTAEASRTMPPPEPATEPATEPSVAAGPQAVAAPEPAAPAPPATPAPARAAPARADDAINLGSTVLPILFKTYWKQGLAALVVIAVIIWLVAR